MVGLRFPAPASDCDHVPLDFRFDSRYPNGSQMMLKWMLGFSTGMLPEALSFHIFLETKEEVS
jgi:hypothetical protein